VLTGRDDRFFPLAFQQRVARERLNLTVDQIPGGHLAALSRPKELAEQLLSFLN
jgi:pimeloyl-ACP methyl ester carboxylesterase